MHKANQSTVEDKQESTRPEKSTGAKKDLAEIPTEQRDGQAQQAIESVERLAEYVLKNQASHRASELLNRLV